MLTRYAGALAAMVLVAAPVAAVVVPDGTATFVALFNPDVNLATTPNTATFNGATFQISGLGGFASATGGNGSLTGTISFSRNVGATLAQPLANFFTFDDGRGGAFNFSLQSVLTQSYTSGGPSDSFSLYLLGTTSNANLGYDATATSLTLGFNQTASSGYSASGTLAVPPASPEVPEPATWAMFIGGFGLIGGTLRRARTANVSFA